MVFHQPKPTQLFVGEDSTGLLLLGKPILVPSLDLIPIWNELSVLLQRKTDQRNDVCEHLATRAVHLRAVKLLVGAPEDLGPEQHDVAQAISNFQSDVSGGDERKVCANDLAAPVVARLNSASGGCRQVIKNQLAEVESFDLTVDSVQVTVPGHAASARVSSIEAGKTRPSTLSLVKEGGKWKLAGGA